ncbi:glycosyltransferase [Flammeovirga sp. MY04]|uniref:glycosyltransferase n=1 Tax=Flammeovirga sp. MY04 TaxID=1191459 RepID=UPI0008266699|nr:glycosyltransferase [Flammeovirga sp. MY04]ANQ50264.2 glycosyltransferase [Flammeovirga sp. MY04]
MTIKVNILLAARNEEKYLKKCVESLVHQKLDEDIVVKILIGNDQSEDNTLKIAENLKHRYEEVDCYTVPNHKDYKGKLNVLHFLSQKVEGQYLLFADADTIYPNSWVNFMLKSLQKSDFVTGVTIPKRNSFLDRWQRLEWMQALKNLQMLSVFNIGVTAMGNNMGISKAAFDAIGGYNNIKTTAVEDFILFNKHLKSGGDFIQLFQYEVLAETEGVDSILLWLKQRNRWFQGGKKTHPLLIFLNYINILTLPFLVFFSLLYPQIWSVTVSILLLKFLMLVIFQYQLKIKIDWWMSLFYEPIYSFMYLRLFIYRFSSPAIDWKGRLYKSE